MGNRAVITFATESDIDEFIDTSEEAKALSLAGAPLRGFTEANPHKVGIYMHWNGGVSSVKSFLEAAKLLKIRDGIYDNSYCIARLAQVIGNFFGGVLSVGVGTLERLDTNNYDNGVYVVDGDWNIIGREFATSEDEDEYDPEEFMDEILQHMPKSYLKEL